MKKHSRRFQKALARVKKDRLYEPLEALALLRELSQVKFVETAEAHIALGLDPKYADQQLRSTFTLPKGTGKALRITVITKEARYAEAISAGADTVGAEDLVAEITQGRLDFDKLIATPDLMLSIAKLGKILGPKGLMPSPKGGTVTYDLENTIREFKAGKVEYRIDRTGVLHVPFGKLNFSCDDLHENLIALQQSIDKNRPQGAKGKYWKSVHFSSTMGPSIPVNVNMLQENSRQ